MALFFESMLLQCARKLLDTADIRDAIFQQPPSIKQVQSRNVEVGYGKPSQIP
jgi:hypothetical protein